MDARARLHVALVRSMSSDNSCASANAVPGSDSVVPLIRASNAQSGRKRSRQVTDGTSASEYQFSAAKWNTPLISREHIENIAKAAVMVEAADLPGLVSLHDLCDELRVTAESDACTDVVRATESVLEAIEAIVHRTIDDAEAGFREVVRSIEHLQKSFDSLESPTPESPVISEETPPVESAPDVATSAPVALEPTPATPAGAADPSDNDLLVIVIDDDMVENLKDFLCESREHIAQSEQALLELERTPEDTELINTVFRAFHTIKGVAGFMNLGPIVRLAHSAEYLLDGARNGEVTLNSQCLSVVLNTCDLMGQMIQVLEGGAAPTSGQLKAIVRQLEAAAKGEIAPNTSAATDPAATAPAEKASNPSPAPPVEAGGPGATVKASEVAPATAPVAPAPVGEAAGNAQQKRVDQTVKVSTGRMDMLVDMVGELVIAQQMVVQDPAVRTLTEQRIQRNLTMVGKIIRDLQEVSMSLRMVPIKATFQKMARLVRDVSAKNGKQITLLTEGEDVELDRNVVEEIADPLVHMIRNACDHGIESGEQRVAAGKSVGGHVSLRAFHSGGSIVIEIEDDGKGLDRSKIMAKAVEKGIYSADRPAAEIPDSEIFNLVFLPGFSTAEKVTDISGRGVGMDVVRRNIESLRGKVEIRSVLGQGTVFSMHLPLTMAIIDGMVVRVGSQRYVVPTLSIERSFRPEPKDIHTVVGRGETAMVRGQILPIHRLQHILGHSADEVHAAGQLLLVVETQGSRACLAVDEIIGQQQVVIKTLGQSAQSMRGISGGAILGDGRVALILDIGGILVEATTAAA